MILRLGKDNFGIKKVTEIQSKMENVNENLIRWGGLAWSVAYIKVGHDQKLQLQTHDVTYKKCCIHEPQQESKDVYTRSAR